MQGPGGMSQNSAECALKGEQLKEEDRDPCSSPPQKRLKQAHIPFKATNLASVNNGLPKSCKLSETPEKVDNNKKISSFFEPQKDDVISGMVKAKPNSPDEKIIKLDSNMNMVQEKSPEKRTEKLDNGHVAESGNIVNVTPTKSVLNTSTSSIESSPGSSANQDDNVEVICVVTPTQSKPITKLAKSSEKLKREAERQAKKEERLEKQRLREQERQEAKAKKEQERLEAKRKKEEEKEKKEKERLEKKMIEDKEREDKNRKKEEEKRKREEERLAKLEEKNKKEEERKQQEEEELRKKQKAQSIFKSFFKAVPATPKQVAPVPKNTFEERFQPFLVSKNVEMAPLTRRSSFDEKSRQALSDTMNLENFVSTYCNDVKIHHRSQQRRRKKDNEIVSENDPDELVIVEVQDSDSKNIPVVVDNTEKDDTNKKTHKAKLFQFHTNTRPPYYGTWSKRSKVINPRNPLTMDKDLLDYDIDSDDEWEEEDPGESISHSEGEDEGGDDNADNADEDDEDEDGFFVPHGYLSDDEGVGAEEEEEEEKSGLEFDPEKKREQLLSKSRAWEAELARKCKPMKPVVIGCSWTHGDSVDSRLLKYQMCNVVDSPIEVTRPIPKDLPGEVSENNTPQRHPMAMYVPDEAMPELIMMLHGSTAGLVKIMKNFRKYWTLKNQKSNDGNELNESDCSISKRQLERKINEIAVKERRPHICYKACWYVHEKVLCQYGLQDIKIQEQTSASPIEPEPNSGSRSVTPTLPSPGPCQSTPSILQFTKVSPPTNFKNPSDNTSPPKSNIKPSSTIPAVLSHITVNSIADEKLFETLPEPMEVETTLKTANC